MNRFIPCPCGSKQLYPKCCERYHKGTHAENAEVLMRSRYCAYAVGLADYVLDTTHPQNPNHSNDKATWKEDVLRFCDGTSFNGLQIKEFEDGAEIAYVTFTASLTQGSKDATFTEKSKFEKLNGRWFYLSGEIFSRDEAAIRPASQGTV